MIPYSTFIGNLVDSPELRFTPSGKAVARFRMAMNDRKKNEATGEWEDGDSTFLTVDVWEQLAEHVAESLERGQEVMVHGKLVQRQYETNEGEKRTVYEVKAQSVGVSLRRGPVKAAVLARSGGAQQGGFDEVPF